MRFLHLADIHLDAPLSGRSEEFRARLRGAAREALARGLRLAVDESLDAVLIAGDLFDRSYVTFETGILLRTELERCIAAGVSVVYVTGNHDPGRSEKGGASVPWPEGMVVIAGSDPQTVEIFGADGEPVGRVTGAGHAGPRETRDLSATFPKPDLDLPHVALLHTQVHGSPGAAEHQPYAPSERESLEKSGYHYWALGHVHLRGSLSETTPIHYPGCTQGRSVRETGPKGGLLVDLSNPDLPQVGFVELAPLRWERVTVDGLDRADDVESLIQRIVERWWDERRNGERETEVSDPSVEWAVRFELRGPCPLYAELRSEDAEAVASEVEGRLGLLHCEVRSGAVRPPVSVEEHEERLDVLGEAIRMVREVRDDPGAVREWGAGFAREIPEDGKLDEIVALLEGAEEELIHRLRKDGREAE